MNVTIAVFLTLFVFVALLGLFGSRWRAGDLSQLNEWGLGGRSFGTLITWFLLGGGLYTAYKLLVVCGIVYVVGAFCFFLVWRLFLPRLHIHRGARPDVRRRRLRLLRRALRCADVSAAVHGLPAP